MAMKKAAVLTVALLLAATVWLWIGPSKQHPSWHFIEQQAMMAVPIKPAMLASSKAERVLVPSVSLLGNVDFSMDIEALMKLTLAARKAALVPELTLTMKRNAEHTKSRLLVAIISGGSNESLTKAFWRPNVNLKANLERAANRDAILATWASNHTYFVTHEDVDTTRVVSLSAKAEIGGRDALPRKSMRMWQQLWEQFGDQGYEWFMKVRGAGRKPC
jgi:hypothetical protein